MTRRAPRGPGRDPRGLANDDGTVLLLVVGCVVVLAMLLAVVVDAGRLYLARRSLDATTDAAALAGAQGVDLGAVYQGAEASNLPLEPDLARRKVRRYLESADAADRFRGFDLVGVVVEGDEVSVRTSAEVRLPFVGPFVGERGVVVLRAEATARNRLAD